jgi:membrane protein DedA with SNARE-associated domain
MRTRWNYFPFFILWLCLIAGIQPHIHRLDACAGETKRDVAGSEAAAGESHTGTAEQKSPKQNRLMEDLEHAIARVQPLLDRYGYPTVFVAVLVEGFGLVAPGQTILIAAALAAARGDLNLFWILLLAFAAAILGNSLGYFIGIKGGRPLLLKLHVREERLQRLEGYFGRYGKGVVVFGRFFDGLRQLNGIVAGILHMPWKTFTFCNILGAALWTGTWGLGSYMLEKEIAKVHLTIRLVEPLIMVMLLLGVLAFFIYVLWPVRKTSN